MSEVRSPEEFVPSQFAPVPQTDFNQFLVKFKNWFAKIKSYITKENVAIAGTAFAVLAIRFLTNTPVVTPEEFLMIQKLITDKIVQKQKDEEARIEAENQHQKEVRTASYYNGGYEVKAGEDPNQVINEAIQDVMKKNEEDRAINLKGMKHPRNRQFEKVEKMKNNGEKFPKKNEQVEKIRKEVEDPESVTGLWTGNNKDER